MKQRLMPLFVLSTIIFTVTLVGCSKDDPITPPQEHKVNIQLKAGMFFSFNRWDLTQQNTKDESTKRTYNVELRGNGGILLGAYNDWLYRIGTDAKTLMKDTLFIRVEPSNSEVQAYGFVSTIISEFIELVPTSTDKPSAPSSRWDIVGKYDVAVGTTWNIHDVTKYPNGIDLAFKISGPTGPVDINVNVKLTGKYEAREEVLTVGSKTVKTYHTSVSVILNILGGEHTEKLHFWFSDDPSAQVKFMQESLTIDVGGLGLLKIPIAGEVQELIQLP